METLPSADIVLARRLERTEATANAALVDARSRVTPDVGATWIDVAGVYAMFDGIGSPLTQTFGLGVFEACLAGEFERIEAFFDVRGASTCHEVSSFAAAATQRLLPARGYAPIEDSVVLIRSTSVKPPKRTTGLTVRLVSPEESASWAQVSARGWGSESPDLAAFVEQLGCVTAQARGMHCFVAEADGQPIATAALHLATDVALLAGASTIPAARGRGAQSALLHARLAYAASHGTGVAMVVTQPASGSHRNAERQGFRPMYARTKWERRASGNPP